MLSLSLGYTCMLQLYSMRRNLTANGEMIVSFQLKATVPQRQFLICFHAEVAVHGQQI